MTAYIFLLMTAVTIQQFGATRSPGWRHQHPALDLTVLVCTVGSILLLLEGLRYGHRLRRLGYFPKTAAARIRA